MHRLTLRARFLQCRKISQFPSISGAMPDCNFAQDTFHPNVVPASTCNSLTHPPNPPPPPPPPPTQTPPPPLPKTFTDGGLCMSHCRFLSILSMSSLPTFTLFISSSPYPPFFPECLQDPLLLRYACSRDLRLLRTKDRFPNAFAHSISSFPLRLPQIVIVGPSISCVFALDRSPEERKDSSRGFFVIYL